MAETARVWVHLRRRGRGAVSRSVGLCLHHHGVSLPTVAAAPGPLFRGAVTARSHDAGPPQFLTAREAQHAARPAAAPPSAAAPAATLPTRVAERPCFTGLTNPANVGTASNGRVFVGKRGVARRLRQPDRSTRRWSPICVRRSTTTRIWPARARARSEVPGRLWSTCSTRRSPPGGAAPT